LNEEENLPELTNALEEYLKTFPVPVEVIFVDDGSSGWFSRMVTAKKIQ
jgi:dolichol-phosphate mannosyltransferase